MAKAKLVTPPFYDWVAWRLGREQFKAAGLMSAKARPKAWAAAVPASYFPRLAAFEAGLPSGPPPPPPLTHAQLLRAKVVTVSRGLVGIREQPPGSNSGPAVRRLQSSTGAYGAAWCVSTVQWEDVQTVGSTYADRTAGAFYYAQFAHDHGDVIAAPVVGCAVVYHEGAGHAGRVVAVYPGGLFDAVEGNYADSVARVRRSVHVDPCTFILRREYR